MSESCHLHIVHVVSGDLWAGAEVQLFTLVKTLHAQLGTTVSVIILNPGRLEQELRKTGIRVVVLDEAKLNGIRILQRLIRTVRELKPDVIHTHRTKENILGSIAAKLSGIPSLRTVHGAPEHVTGWHDVPKRIIQFLDRVCGRFLQCSVIAVSEDLAKILREDFPSELIHVIENGVDIDAIVQSATQSKNRASASTLSIGIAGRLVPVKRVDIFIRTAKYLHDMHGELNLDFHIYGDGPLRNELEALARSLDTGLYLRFEGHCDDLPAVLRNLDLLLMTSDHEGLPMILLEAMTLQIPVIAHRAGGITSLLDQGECGVLVEDHRPEGYARAVRELCMKPEQRGEIARKALQRVKTGYSARQNAENYCIEYRKILQGRSHGRA